MSNSTTLTISKGNQYDAEGYVITNGILRSYGKIDNTKATGYSVDGTLWLGQYPCKDEISAAILATLADGIERTMCIKSDKSSSTSGDQMDESNICPICHTYCYGDCQL